MLPAETGWPRLAHDATAHQLRVAPGGGFIGAPRVESRGSETRLVIPTGRPEAAAVVGRSRARFRVRMAGGLVGALPDSLPEDGVLRDLDASPSPGGVTFELALDAGAAGWRLERDVASGTVSLSFLRQPEPGYEPFAPEGAAGPRQLRTVVIDPGHGGTDRGVEAEGVSEKTLTVELALRVAGELERRGHVRVALTRREDLAIPQEMRAEAANRENADAVISLHFGAFPSREAHGTLAWCPPANQATEASSVAAAAGILALLPWRDVALERAVESRGLAESITSSLERAGFGPSSVRERLPLALVGVQSPGVLLECGALTNPQERDRLLSPAGMRALAIAIADGVLAWQRNE
jgi:N-acetylmuramoyl-L-alanine amidase